MVMFGINETPVLRKLQCIAALVIWFKSAYFLQLHDDISPLVSIIGLIFIEIVPFMVCLMIIVFGYASAFYLIGRN